MTTATDITEAVQSGVLKALEASQRLTIEALTAVSSTIDGYLPEVPTLPFTGVVSPQEVIDAGFGFTERLLTSQKAFLTELVSLATREKSAA
jgi:hypothetical protein